MTTINCPECGKPFTPWRAKKYCSEKCAARVRKRAERAMTPDRQETQKIPEQNQASNEGMSRDESPSFIVRHSDWIAVNDCTDKFQYKGGAIGWTMNIDGFGWFGRVGKEMSFGPTNRRRARQAVEAFLTGEDFPKLENERSWRGDCWRLVNACPPHLS